ncbi:MAG TPA: hypothetical protein VI072_09715 [Polyangiaceae bacterium]
MISPVNGCRPTYDFTNPTGWKVSVIGDSLIWYAQLCEFFGGTNCAEHIDVRLNNAGRRAWVQAIHSMSFYSWLNVIREHATTVPRVAVVALGTNDAMRQATAGSSAARDARRAETTNSMLAGVRAMLSPPPAGRNTCVVLVTASEKHATAGYTNEAGWVNNLMVQTSNLAEFAGKIKIVNWAAETRAHCGASWLTNPSQTCDWFSSDQLHLVGAGDERRNDLILTAINSCLS